MVAGAELTVADDDLGVTLTADTDSGTNGNQKTLSEDAATVGVRVRARFSSATSNDLGSAYVVRVNAGEASPQSAAGGGVDFTAPGSAVSVSIPTGTTSLSSGWVDLTGLSLTDDTVAEGSETFEVAGTVAGSATVTADTLTITDDDTAVVLSVSPVGVLEQAAAHSVTVTARFDAVSSVLGSATAVTVSVAAADTDGATVASSVCPTTTHDVCTDQTNNQFTVSIPDMGVSGSGSIGLTARADGDNTEGVEYVEFSGTTGAGALVRSAAPARLGVYDPGRSLVLSFHQPVANDPALPGIGVGAGAGIVEDGGAQTVRVRATLGAAAAAETMVTVNVGAAGGTAVEGSSGDYISNKTTADITIAGGQTNGTTDVMLTPAADTVVEGPETVRFTGSAAGYLPAIADLTITETISLVLSGSSAAEGESDGGGVTVTASFAGATSSGLTSPTDVGLGFFAGDRAEAADFTAPSPALTVTIPAGSVSSSARALTGLTIASDSIAEGTEKIDVRGSVEGFTVEDTELSITDDDLGITLVADTDTEDDGYQKDLAEGETPAVWVFVGLTALTNDLGSAVEVELRAAESSPRSAEGRGNRFHRPRRRLRCPFAPATGGLPRRSLLVCWLPMTRWRNRRKRLRSPVPCRGLTG